MTEKITGFFSSLQGISLLVITISALIFILLERLYPYTKGQKIIREGFFNDIVFYTVIQSYVLGLIIFVRRFPGTATDKKDT